MPEYRQTSSFPVVLHDGNHEIQVGNVEVHPLIEFKNLASILSEKIGIDPDRVTISIVKSSSSASYPRKMILHENKIFSHILQKDKDCYFLVSLKSPPRRGKRGGRNRGGIHQDYTTQNESLHKRLLSNPPQKVLLRRDSSAIPLQPSYYHDPISTQNLRLGYRDYATQLQIQKENYLMSMINSYPYEDFSDICGYGRNTSCGGGRAAVCDVCSNAGGGPVPFHWCVYDATTVGFRSPAGPIARPSKG